MTKYRAVRTVVNGIKFASKHEAKVYAELKLRERLGEISALTLQVPYEIAINGVKCFKYIADFTFIENGKTVVVDAKGMRTPVYALKRKCVQAAYGIQIKEV